MNKFLNKQYLVLLMYDMIEPHSRIVNIEPHRKAYVCIFYVFYCAYVAKKEVSFN